MTITKTSPAEASSAADPKAAPATKSTLVTLEQLAKEMNVPPRDARMLLRLAAKQTRLYPTLGKKHVARQPWAWEPGSKALAEARKALTANS